MAGEWWRRGSNPGEPQVGSSVAAMVQAFLEERKEQDRSDGWHVSSVYHLCPREAAMKAILGAGHAKVFDARLLSRFDVGTALHRWWQDEYLGPTGILHGEWVCSACKEVVAGTMPMTSHGCVGHARWQFSEMRASYKEEGWSRPIVGRCDGEIDCDPPEGETDRLGILEIKTASFMPIKEIQGDYMWQAQAYMHLRGRKWTRFLFIDPACLFKNDADAGHSLACQEIVVRYDPRYWEIILARVREVERVVARTAGGAYASAGADFAWPDKICPDKQCRTAQRCGFKDRCFDAVEMARAQLRIREGRDPVTGGEIAQMPGRV